MYISGENNPSIMSMVGYTSEDLRALTICAYAFQ